ncbi:uncharacterized protein BJ171DRAFT_620922 [Polychytrium aggregatum]|uniref:uncharacterized protein n=1 Tax=Polychytrium aggregatum TaxID=110093 RepID=UPI0022FE81DF|nr:uncharacterized protein BJ171DRAFT_620922 [Polychytrium aggregatum]KAI9209469.1 hypothetical protein BJ171DRAFT_620922 [Polychytrium aggregatum]
MAAHVDIRKLAATWNSVPDSVYSRCGWIYPCEKLALDELEPFNAPAGIPPKTPGAISSTTRRALVSRQQPRLVRDDPHESPDAEERPSTTYSQYFAAAKVDVNKLCKISSRLWDKDVPLSLLMDQEPDVADSFTHDVFMDNLESCFITQAEAEETSRTFRRQSYLQDLHRVAAERKKKGFLVSVTPDQPKPKPHQMPTIATASKQRRKSTILGESSSARPIHLSHHLNAHPDSHTRSAGSAKPRQRSSNDASDESLPSIVAETINGIISRSHTRNANFDKRLKSLHLTRYSGKRDHVAHIDIPTIAVTEIRHGSDSTPSKGALKTPRASHEDYGDDSDRSNSKLKLSTGSLRPGEQPDRGSRVLDHTIDLLRKRERRSRKDVQHIFAYLRAQRAFKNISSQVLKELCTVATLVECGHNKVIFSQGDIGTCWYVVLTGKVNIWTSNSSTNANILVATIEAGDGFGELALLNEVPRSGTAVTAGSCMLLKVEKIDYNRVVRQVCRGSESGFAHKFQYHENVLFLRRVGTLSTLTSERLHFLASIMVIRGCDKGQFILSENQIITYVHFIIKGTCEVLKSLHMDDGSTILVRLGLLRELDYFGEAPIVMNTARETKSSISVRSITECKLGCLQIHSAREELSGSVASTEYWNWTEDQTLSTYLSTIDKKHWERYKSKVLTRIMRERLQDASFDLKRYRTEWAATP